MRRKHRPLGKRRALSILGAFVFAMSVLSLDALAEELEDPRPRQGYYVSLGLHGILDGNVTGDAEWSGPWPGAGGEFRFGEAVTRFLDLGLNLGASTAIDSDYMAVMGHVAIDAQFRLKDPLFIRASLGFGFVDVTRQKKDAAKIDSSVGASYQVAVGYDFFPAYTKGSGGFALTPVVGMEVVQSELITALVGFVGVEITWWTGLKKDKLLLPDAEAYK